MSNDNPYADPEPRPVTPAMQPAAGSRKSSFSPLLVAVLVLVAFFPLCCCGIGLLLPAVQAAREAARRMNCSNNMKEIGLALQNYQTVYGSLPPAYTVDSNGQRLHSWRTLILPYLDHEEEYEQIDLEKPWDDPANAAIAESVIPIYSCPSTVVEPTMTTYLAVVDERGLMRGSEPVSLDDVPDGLFATLVVAEADSGHAVPWMSPQDIDLPTFQDAGMHRSAGGHVAGAHVLTADIGVRFVTDSADAGIRESLVYRDDGEEVTLDDQP